MGNMAPSSHSPDFSPAHEAASSRQGKEDLELVEAEVNPQDEPEAADEIERRADSNRSAMDLYLKDPALQRPILDKKQQRALFVRLAEARTAFSREITQHPLALVYLNSLYER